MRAVLYAAKSTEDVRGSIPTQLEDGRKFAEREGWEVAGQFSDEGFSAFSGNRGPGLEAAKKLAAKLASSDGEAVLVAQHSDRLARGSGDSPDAAEHLVEVLTWANRNGVKLRTVQDDLFGDSRFGMVMAALMGQRNTEDSRRKSLAVAAGAKRKAQRGERTGGPRPFGYRYGTNGFEPHPAEAEVVKRIYADTIAGKSQLQIARELEREGVKTVQGGRWQNCSVMAVLDNKTHCGYVKHHGEWYPGKHEPVIDEATWEKAQATRAGRRKSTPGGRPPAGSHLFRKGMLRCGECGEALAARTSPNRKGKPSETYRCLGRHRDKETCSMKPVKRELIDQAIYSYFEKVGLDVEATRQQLSEERNRKLREVAALLADAESERAKAQGAVERVERDYLDGNLSAPDYSRLRERSANELSAAESEAQRLRASKDSIERDEELIDAEAETLKMLTDLRRAIAGQVKDAEGVEAVRAALVRMFDGFVVHRGEDPYVEPRETPTPILESAGLTIEVWVRPQTLVGFDRNLLPILEREPLNSALASREKGGETESRLNSFFGPIPVPAQEVPVA